MISTNADVINSDIIIFSSSDFESIRFVLKNWEDKNTYFFVGLLVLDSFDHDGRELGLLE